MAGKKPAKRGPKPTGVTAGTNFRLSPEVLAELDFIAESLTQETGVPHTRTDAVRAATKREADRLREKTGQQQRRQGQGNQQA